jgi:hypothetical protein
LRKKLHCAAGPVQRGAGLFCAGRVSSTPLANILSDRRSRTVRFLLAACRTLLVESRIRLCEGRFLTICRPKVVLWAKKRRE